MYICIYVYSLQFLRIKDAYQGTLDLPVQKEPDHAYMHV